MNTVKKEKPCECIVAKQLNSFLAETGHLSDKVRAEIHNATIHANGSIVSAIFYLKFNIKTDKMEFNGNDGGVAIPGAAYIDGDIYFTGSNTEIDLLNNTVSFAFVSTPVYCAVFFIDSNSSTIAHLQSGSIGLITGTGGGTGSWSV